MYKMQKQTEWKYGQNVNDGIKNIILMCTWTNYIINEQQLFVGRIRRESKSYIISV